MVTWCEKASCFGNFPIVQTSLGGSRLNLPQLPDGAHRYHRWNIQIHTATKIIHKTDLLWYLLPYGYWSIMIIYDIYYPMDPAVASERNYDLRRWFRKKRHTSQRVFGISRATSIGSTEGSVYSHSPRISLASNQGTVFLESCWGDQGWEWLRSMGNFQHHEASLTMKLIGLCENLPENNHYWPWNEECANMLRRYESWIATLHDP